MDTFDTEMGFFIPVRSKNVTFHLVILIKGRCSCWTNERQDISGYSTHNRVWQTHTEVLTVTTQSIVEPCAQVNTLEECLHQISYFQSCLEKLLRFE